MIDRYRSPPRRNNATWKGRSKRSPTDSSDNEELDLSQPLHAISYYIDDREQMIEQVFSSIKSERLQRLLAPCLKDVPLEELKTDCLIHLMGMSKKRILSVIQGRDLHSSSDTESDSAPDNIDKSVTDEIINSNTPKSVEKRRNSRSGSRDRPKNTKNISIPGKFRGIKINLQERPKPPIKTKVPTDDECELDIAVSEDDMKDLMQCNKAVAGTILANKQSVSQRFNNTGSVAPTTTSTTTAAVPAVVKKFKELNPPVVKKSRASTDDNERRQRKTEAKLSKEKSSNTSAGGISGGTITTVVQKPTSSGGTIVNNKTLNNNNNNNNNNNKKAPNVHSDVREQKTKPKKKKITTVEAKKRKSIKMEITSDKQAAAMMVEENLKNRNIQNNNNNSSNNDNVAAEVDDKGVLEIMELEIKAEAIRALLENHDDDDLDVKAELLGLTDLSAAYAANSTIAATTSAAVTDVKDINNQQSSIPASAGGGTTSSIKNKEKSKKKTNRKLTKKNKAKKSSDGNNDDDKDKKVEKSKKKKSVASKAAANDDGCKPKKKKDKKNKNKDKKKPKRKIKENNNIGGGKLKLRLSDYRNMKEPSVKVPGCQDIDSDDENDSIDLISSANQVAANNSYNNDNNNNNSNDNDNNSNNNNNNSNIRSFKRKSPSSQELPHQQQCGDLADADSSSWPQRWLESRNVKDVVTTSKICANIRKRMRLARLTKQASSSQEDAAAGSKNPGDDLNLDITGSVGEYYRLQSTDNKKFEPTFVEATAAAIEQETDDSSALFQLE